MPAMKFSIRVIGTGKALAALRLLGRRVEQDVMPEAGLAGGQVLLEEVRVRTPVDKRHLLPSLGLVVVPDGRPGLRIYVGPQPGHKWFGRSTGWHGRAKLHDPEEYAWYQEEGFYHVLARRRIAGRRFMRRGFAVGKARALDKVKNVIAGRLRTAHEGFLEIGRG